MCLMIMCSGTQEERSHTHSIMRNENVKTFPPKNDSIHHPGISEHFSSLVIRNNFLFSYATRATEGRL